MKAYDKIEEYNAFGPWIYLIGEEHALPPLFVSHCPEADSAQILIKVPRKIDRRDANPDMHLYDRVIGLKDDFLFVLTQVGDDVVRETLAIADIRAIQKTRDLLGGQLQLCMEHSVYSIEYSTVSDDIISRIVTMIRQKWDYKKLALSLPHLPYSVEAIGFGYFNLVEAVRRNESDSRVVAYQPQMSMRTRKFWDFLSRYKHRRVFQSSAFLSNAHELITVCQSSFIQSARHTDYAYSYIYVPFCIITDAKIVPHPQISGLRQFEYGILGHRFSTAIGDGNVGIDDLCKELNRISLH